MTYPDWDIRREGHRLPSEISSQRLYQAPRKIEFVGGIFASDRERLTVQGMLLEALGMDRVVKEFGKVEDWKAAIAERERLESERNP